MDQETFRILNGAKLILLLLAAMVALGCRVPIWRVFGGVAMFLGMCVGWRLTNRILAFIIDLTRSPSSPDTNFPTEDEIARAATVAAVDPPGFLILPPMESRGESTQIALKLRNNIRIIFQDNLLQRVTQLINGFRKAENVPWFNRLGFYKTFPETSGCMVFYTKAVRPIWAKVYIEEVKQKKLRGAFLHVLGGVYGDRVDWDFNLWHFPTAWSMAWEASAKLNLGAGLFQAPLTHQSLCSAFGQKMQ